MGRILVSDGTTYKPGTISVQTGTGFAPGKKVYVYDGFAWVLRYERSTTVPQAPDIRANLVARERRVIEIFVRTPSSSSIKRVVLKAGTSWPTSPEGPSGYYSDRDGSGIAWSEVLTTPGAELRRQLPEPYQALSLPYDTTIYIAAWTQNTDGNWSAASTTTVRTLAPTGGEQATQLRTLSAYVYPESSSSYANNGGYWRSDNNYAYQGGLGFDWAGLWFYGDKIRTLLKDSFSINKMQVNVQRIPGSEGADTAQVNLVSHPFVSQPATTPINGLSAVAGSGTLAAGASRYVDIPAAFYSGFQPGGDTRGIGLYSGGNASTAQQLTAYGAGTESGKLYIEWTQF